MSTLNFDGDVIVVTGAEDLVASWEHVSDESSARDAGLDSFAQATRQVAKGS